MPFDQLLVVTRGTFTLNFCNIRTFPNSLSLPIWLPTCAGWGPPPPLFFLNGRYHLFSRPTLAVRFWRTLSWFWTPNQQHEIWDLRYKVAPSWPLNGRFRRFFDYYSLIKKFLGDDDWFEYGEGNDDGSRFEGVCLLCGVGTHWINTIRSLILGGQNQVSHTSIV